MRKLASSELDIKEVLLWDIRDMLMQDTYFNSVTSLKDYKSHQAREILKDAPKETPRPGDQPTKKFLNGRELQAIFNNKKKR